MIRLEPPRWYRYFSNTVALLLVVLAGVLLYSLAQAARLFGQSGAPVWIIELLQTVMLLGLVPIAGGIYLSIVLPRTRVVFSDIGLRLEHPLRTWTGSWPQVRRAFLLHHTLYVQTETDWRLWHLRLGPKRQQPLVEDLRAMVGPSRWLSPPEARRFIALRALPALLTLALLGAGALHLVQTKVDAEPPRPNQAAHGTDRN